MKKEKTSVATTNDNVSCDSALGTDIGWDSRFSQIDEKMLWTDQGMTIMCSHIDDEWVYHITKNGVAITRKIKSKKSPQEDDPRVRDAQIKKSMERLKDEDRVDTIFDMMNDFGLFLMAHEEIIETHLNSTAKPQEKQTPIIDAQLVSQAIDILENGDPIKFIMDEFHRHHVGDDEYGRLLVLAIASQHVMNTHGIHLTPSGASGKGKSHAGKTILHLLPHEYWIESSLSAMALYYMDLDAKIIIFSDDTNISEDLMSTIRRCITNFTTPISHQTVDGNRKGTTLTIPERIIWIIASVENFMDEQTRNRMIDVPVDESAEIDELVFKKQVEDAKTAQSEFPETEGVAVCREIFRIIKNLDPIPVSIPFADDIVWTMKNNRRNFDVFKEMIKAYTLFRYEKRAVIDGILEATLEDFHDAKKLYITRAESEITGITGNEMPIIRALEEHGECTLQELMNITGITQTTLHNRLHGRSDRGKAGMLERTKNLIYHNKESRKIDDDTTRIMNVYGIVKNNPLSHYSEIVGLKMNSK